MMVRYLLYYTFHRADAVSLHRLIRLKNMNPDATVVPVFGVAQTISFPIPKLPKRYKDNFDWVASRSNKLLKVTRAIDTSVETFRRRSELQSIAALLQKSELSMYCDFTPVGKINQDLVIINWFARQGKNYDFDILIYARIRRFHD